MNHQVSHQEHDLKNDESSEYLTKSSSKRLREDIRNKTAIWAEKRSVEGKPYIIHGPAIGDEKSRTNIVPTLQEEISLAKRKLSPTQTVVKQAPLEMDSTKME